MSLNKKFQKAASSYAIKISTMEVDRKYQITHAERMVTKYGPTVLISIKDSEYNIVKVFMPKGYSSVFTDDDINSLNSQKVSLRLIYKELREKTKSYVLAVE
jgi:hypothetical protein